MRERGRSLQATMNCELLEAFALANASGYSASRISTVTLPRLSTNSAG